MNDPGSFSLRTAMAAQDSSKKREKEFKNNAHTHKVQKCKCIMNRTPKEVKSFSLSSLLHDKIQSSIFGGPEWTPCPNLTDAYFKRSLKYRTLIFTDFETENSAQVPPEFPQPV